LALKAVLEHISLEQNATLIIKKIALNAFDAPYHFHPEIELTYIIKGSGKRYVGHSVFDFQSGDLVLLGPDLAHCWLSNPEPDSAYVEALVIQFKPEFMGRDFFKLKAFEPILKVLDKAKNGLFFPAEGIKTVLDLILKMPDLTDTERHIKLLEILFLLSKNQEKQVLLPHVSDLSTGAQSSQRLQRVFSYIIENYKRQISLEKAAEAAHLSQTSFCRYIKKVSGKTFFDIVLDYRIAEAKQLLSTQDKSMAELALELGFNDTAYFIKQFKKKTGSPPLVYRKTMIEK
jgi:AraC-like DNA-binding protein